MCFKSPFFDKRINGISAINDMICLVQNSINSSSVTYASGQRANSEPFWIESEYSLLLSSKTFATEPSQTLCFIFLNLFSI